MQVQDVDIAEATTTLPVLLASLEKGMVHEIVITRVGHPVARLVPVEPVRIGVAKGKFQVPDDIDSDRGEIASFFRGESRKAGPA